MLELTARSLRAKTSRGRRACLLSAVLLGGGCTGEERAELGTALEGEACSQVSDCQAGLDCVDAVCEPFPGASAGPRRGDCCDATLFLTAFPAGTCADEVSCGSDLVCGTQGACTTFAGHGFGEPCGLDVDCISPLICHGHAGLCVDPDEPNDFDGDGEPDNNPDGTCPGDLPELLSGLCPSSDFGSKDLGEECTGFGDCRRPYLCAVGSVPSTCVKLPFFAGPNCIRSDDELGLFRVYFEVPPATIPDPYEFYRLPFPNDIRLNDGKIDLSGHVSPGQVLGIDVADTIFRAVEEDSEGFGLNAPIFFRLTDPLALESLCLDPGSAYPPAPAGREFCADDGDATVFLVNIDPSSPGEGERVPVQMSFTAPRGQYACQNLLAIGPLDGQPLRPLTTYAAVITTGIRDELDTAPIQDRDFTRVLEADSDLPAAVLAATAPLRDWIESEALDATEIAAATVFTTGNPIVVADRLHAAVEALPDPSFEPGAFRCVDETSGPLLFGCHGAGLHPERACPAATNPGYDEIHGTYMGPVFQAGTRPYLTPDLGGAMDLVSPTDIAGDEEMCFAMAVPTSPMPADGWPVIIVGHGTGGNYRLFFDEPDVFNGGRDFVELLTSLGFAVIGFDNALHGPRQGPVVSDIGLATPITWTKPDNLFFNIINARAARDNILQGAVDLFWLTRLVAEEGARAPLDRTLVVGGVDIAFDPTKIVYFGHSQGTTIVYPYMLRDTRVRAAVLSGAGAELALSILHKREPVNIAAMAGAVFADNNLTRLHPMMGVLAHLFAPSDAVSYGRDVLLRPGNPSGPLPTLIFSGVGDTYSPDQTQDALFTAMDIPLLPATGTFTNNVADPNSSATVTAGVVRLAPGPGYDGHFVTFNDPDDADVENPLSSFLTSSVADVGDVEIVR